MKAHSVEERARLLRCSCQPVVVLEKLMPGGGDSFVFIRRRSLPACLFLRSSLRRKVLSVLHRDSIMAIGALLR